MDDYQRLDALQRVGAVLDVKVMEADCKEFGERVSKDYVIIEFCSEGEPESLVTCRTLDHLALEMVDRVQQMLERKGGRRFIEAIAEGDISAEEFNHLAGDIEGPWHVQVENHLLDDKLPAGASAKPVKRL
jgi:hypothetical protein